MNVDELISNISKLGYSTSVTGFSDSRSLAENNFMLRYWHLPRENIRLKGTPFYYSNENDFIHFTSMEAFFNILASKHMRLYNLTNMDDRFELEYANSELSLRANVVRQKENIYILSLCKGSLLNEEIKKHLLWKLHGRDGYGVILRLNFKNEFSSWLSYYLTSCFYNLDNFKAIIELNKFTNKEIFDVLPAASIKLPIYEFEDEIRLIFDYRTANILSKNNVLIYPKTYLDKLNRKENISYFQLPLYNFSENVNDAYPFIPKIYISEVILGYRYNSGDLKNIQDKTSSMGIDLPIRLSELKKYF